jgi:2-oxoglutarate ferredoxin oxidoreductase subunit alpha
MAQEAMRIAVEYMTPVFLLTDGYIANGSEPWKIPRVADLKPISVKHPTRSNTDNGFLPYQRTDQLVRPWAIPGTPGLEHRIGGLEKADGTGNISYEAENHHHMTMVRKQKVANVAKTIPDQTVLGPQTGDLLVVSWGGTYGAVRSAVEACQKLGKSVAHCHLRYMNPFPRNLGEILKRYKKVFVPELNAGQLCFILRANFLVDAVSFAKIKGKPFLISELVQRMEALIAD